MARKEGKTEGGSLDMQIFIILEVRVGILLNEKDNGSEIWLPSRFNNR